MTEFNPLSQAAAVIGLLAEIQRDLTDNNLDTKATAQRATQVLAPEMIALLIAADNSQAIIDKYRSLFEMALSQENIEYFQHPSVIAWLDLILADIKDLQNG